MLRLYGWCARRVWCPYDPTLHGAHHRLGLSLLHLLCQKSLFGVWRGVRDGSASVKAFSEREWKSARGARENGRVWAPTRTLACPGPHSEEDGGRRTRRVKASPAGEAHTAPGFRPFSPLATGENNQTQRVKQWVRARWDVPARVCVGLCRKIRPTRHSTKWWWETNDDDGVALSPTRAPPPSLGCGINSLSLFPHTPGWL